MKIAIVCDWLVTYAGAEKVLTEMIRCFPEADLFSVIDYFSAENRALIGGKQAKTTFIQRLPFAKTHYRSYLPLMPMAIEQLDVSGYDVVISNSHAVAKGVITGPDQIHISYVCSAMRYAWDLQHQYLRDANLTRGIKSAFARYCLHKMRLWDQRTANGVDYFIADSHFVAKRIWKIYRRDADVIYPPVDTLQFTPGVQKEEYYMTASRLVPYKKVDLIVDAFANMPDKKLIVIGDGPDFKKIKSKATPNIELMGFQSTERLIHYLQRAKAFIFAAEEDFGIAPVEAEACGIPVIAYGKGGALETVRGLDQSQPTGLFFEEQTSSAIVNAIALFERNRFLVSDCVEQAARFSVAQFRTEFELYVNEKWRMKDDARISSS